MVERMGKASPTTCKSAQDQKKILLWNLLILCLIHLMFQKLCSIRAEYQNLQLQNKTESAEADDYWKITSSNQLSQQIDKICIQPETCNKERVIFDVWYVMSTGQYSISIQIKYSALIVVSHHWILSYVRTRNENIQQLSHFDRF